MRNRFLLVLALPCFVVLGVSDLVAQAEPTGDENPLANTGALKSQIETAGSYNAHSGSATRVVPDLRVPGALGIYGLDFVRYYNSLRYDRNKNLFLNPAPEPNLPTDFGSPGWSHSWRWSADYEEYLQEPFDDGGEYIYHTLITITFPDGRASKYKIIRYSKWHGQLSPDPRFGPPYYANRNETNWPGGKDDHLAEMAQDGSNFWLYRADGGSVHFTGGPSGYVATEVYDPNGFKTLLHYNASWQLYRVEQEGGRSLNITWTGGRITRVENASAPMQAVVYNNSTGALTSVTYPNEPFPQPSATPAQYTYVTLPAPTGFSGAGPLLATAKDPRFEGAMTNISYTYRGTGCTPVAQPSPGYTNGQFDYYYSSPTAIEQEKNGLTGQVVSRFVIGCFDGTRTEYNGLGGFRKFFFGGSSKWSGSGARGYELAKVTDFTHINPLPSNLPSDRQSYLNGYPKGMWDGRGILTDLVHGDGSGLPKEVRHTGSDGSFRTYDRVNPGASLSRDTSRVRNPYNHWLFSKTDERFQKTTYTRDERRRITRIDYPDTSYETFSYNIFNQVKSHRLPSGAIKTYVYDNGAPTPTRGQLTSEYNSVDGSAAATTYTYYTSTYQPQWADRVATVRNARAKINNKLYSAMMKYNARGQITEVHYPSTGANPDPTVKYEYDPNGNCIAIINELGQRSTYTYDDYRRCTSYTEPLAAPGWSGTGTVTGRTWNWTYDRVRFDNASIPASAHTSKNWRLQIEPPYDAAGNRRAKVRNYDYNDRLVFEYDSIIQAPNGAWTYPADGAMHSYIYDENGQKKTYTDPRSRVTSYTYDNRNRLFQTIEPLSRTTATLYDVTNNKTKVTFPDLKTQEWLNYDPFGQPRQFKDERFNITDLSYQWGPMKKLDTVKTYRLKDNNTTETQLTNFNYDGLGRKVWTIFPDGSSELNSYLYGQVDAFKTRRDQTKRIHYDARGREDYHTWDGVAAPRVDRQWDEANRLAKIWNSFSIIDYTYDHAGQVITEGNTITGASAGRRLTTYWRYPNGTPAHFIYPNAWRGRRDYTYRGQLESTGQDNTSGVWTYKLGQYTYFADDKVQTETAYNGVQTTYGYDPRGQISTTNTQRVSPVQRYSYRTYSRDTRDRISAWSKSNSPTYNPLENGRGDRYGYDPEGQLTAASYEALTPAGTPTGAKRTESFFYDALGNRVRLNYLAGRGWMDFLRRDNGLNQYSSWTPSVIYYDENYPGWGPPPKGNGVMMAEGYITASYNALNQPVAIWSPATGGSNYKWFGFDPLGRCVKRWVSASGAATTNPATYMYYDGWNLIQEGTGAAGAERIYLPGNAVDRIVCHYNYAAAQWRYHHYDARGHCILLTGPTGNLIEQYEYDAFGKPYFYNGSGTPLPNGSAMGNRFLFTGREWLSDLKLYDYRNRLYQPELGRFLQPDPIQFAAGDYNLYRYCHNDPINRSDPMGLLDLFIYGAGPTGPGYSNNVLTQMAEATGGNTYGRGEKAQMLSDISAARANNPAEPINIVGYSRGAVAANEVTNQLASKDTKVDKLILIDPVTVTGNKGSIDVSKNAGEATVYSQKNGGPFPGTPGTAAPNVKNVDMTDKGSTHRSIPRDVKNPILEKLKNGR